MNFKGKMYEKSGITLIALVVTIIVLLILAGVTIATLTGDNGILTKAQQAKAETGEASNIEKIRLAVLETQIGDNGYQEIDATTFQEALNNQFEGRDLQVTDNKDGSFIISLDNNSKMFYADSNGEIITNENMLEIGTAEELKAFRDDVNNGNSYEGKYVYLTSDIVLDSGEKWEPIGFYPMENSSPEDETNTPFSGIFDGKGYEINGIYINSTDKVQGLFGLVNNGTIKNIGIGENCTITGNISVGAVVGYLYNNSKATNCYNKANIKVGSYSGGTFGQASMNVIIEKCYNEGNITSNDATNYIGGVVGNLTNGSQINMCYNNGNIDCTEVDRVGGIAGQSQTNNSTIDNCFNLGNITGKNYVGGIVGQTYNKALLQNCYNIGNINGNNLIGGMSGMNSSEIYNCYNIGNISGNTSTIRWNSRDKYR